MNVQLLVTQTDFCLPNLKNELAILGLTCQVSYVEQNPELVSRHHIRHSPCVFINGELAFRHQPSIEELKRACR